MSRFELSCRYVEGSEQLSFENDFQRCIITDTKFDEDIATIRAGIITSERKILVSRPKVNVEITK